MHTFTPLLRNRWMRSGMTAVVGALLGFCVLLVRPIPVESDWQTEALAILLAGSALFTGAYTVAYPIYWGYRLVTRGASESHAVASNVWRLTCGALVMVIIGLPLTTGVDGRRRLAKA